MRSSLQVVPGFPGDNTAQRRGRQGGVSGTVIRAQGDPSGIERCPGDDREQFMARGTVINIAPGGLQHVCGQVSGRLHQPLKRGVDFLTDGWIVVGDGFGQGCLVAGDIAVEEGEFLSGVKDAATVKGAQEKEGRAAGEEPVKPELAPQRTGEGLWGNAVASGDQASECQARGGAHRDQRLDAGPVAEVKVQTGLKMAVEIDRLPPSLRVGVVVIACEGIDDRVQGHIERTVGEVAQAEDQVSEPIRLVADFIQQLEDHVVGGGVFLAVQTARDILQAFLTRIEEHVRGDGPEMVGRVLGTDGPRHSAFLEGKGHLIGKQHMGVFFGHRAFHYRSGRASL